MLSFQDAQKLGFRRQISNRIIGFATLPGRHIKERLRYTISIEMAEKAG
jgi:hypothetical protein